MLLPDIANSMDMKVEKSGKSLTILDIDSDKEGEYVCSAVNKGGFNDFTFNVLVNCKKLALLL